MSKNQTVETDEMLAALSRSGYLLEVEVARLLSKSGFFVESSQVIEDPITGKSREIDIIAEYYDRNKPIDNIKACAKIEFVFEIKNNTFPVVLLNNFEFTPKKEDFFGLKELITHPDGMNTLGIGCYYESFIVNAKSGIFSQYCSFQRKKQDDELMALHPDNMYEGISKIVQHCEEQLESWEPLEENENYYKRYFRKFLYLPVLLLKSDLYELNESNLQKVNSSILVVNYHYKSEKRMAYVYVVTMEGLPDFLKFMLETEGVIELGMKRAMANA